MKYIRVCCAGLLIVMTFTFPAAAQNQQSEADGTLETGYFTVHLEKGVSRQELALALSIPPAVKEMVRGGLDRYEEFTLSSQLDMLYLAISEIMDMRMPGFKSTIRFYSDRASLKRAARSYFNRDIPDTAGFYEPETDTLYINSQDITLFILAHELSHAIQCHYFEINPPMRIQEVLAGFVEYQLRKRTGHLEHLRR